MNKYSSHLVNGEWCPSTDAATTPVFESFSGDQSGAVSHADPALVDKAVNAARATFRNWSLAAVSRRAEYVRAVADALAARGEEIAAGISREVGMPLKLSRRIQVDAPAAAWRAAADIGEQMAFTENVGNSLVSLEPAGVVAAITPWNYPLHQITGKLAGALMAGCTVVLKPSEMAPSAAAALGDAILAAGLPPGVVNIVMGGAAVGQMLVDHPGVDMVSFTGSTAVGRRIAASAGAALKRVSLELGGKSPGIAMEDADPQAVVKSVVGACFLNSGQTCSAITRLLVPDSQYETYRPLLASAVGAMPLGSPFDAATRVGPLIS
ncbi:aldehyde dehydrogenase family protein, partial [Noviherbaspirillum denitrificans]|uniref:aldehyde dehydrogenase family protein n=1 Tax=Noviherbaspirillum denitrificans TaxID=1968433 RepID=UPI000B532DFA